jgi:glutathione S-transferase
MYQLYGINDWGSLVVHMALEEIGTDFQFVALDYDRGDLETPQYLAMNPFGLVPVLGTPEGPIFETTAILLYLADRHQSLAPKVQDADRGAFLVWLAVICQQLHPAVLQLAHPERLLGDDASAQVSAAQAGRLRQILHHLNAEAAKGWWWLSGTRPAITSLYAAMLLRWAQCLPPYRQDTLHLPDYPALLAMTQALERRAPIQRVLQREGLYSLGPAPLSAPPYEGDTGA